MTRAKTAFTAARLEIAELLAIAMDLSDEVTNGRRMSAQENQLRQVAVALVAALQAYISELLEEKADEIGNDWNGLSDLQRRYVAVQVRRRIEALLEECQESELAESSRVRSLRRTSLECATWFNDPSLLARSAYRDKLDGFLQDNGANTLDRTISRFGSCGMTFFNWLSKYYPRFRGIEDRLNVLIATRNDVAHGTFERRLTIHEVRIFRVLVYRMIAKIELYIQAGDVEHISPVSAGYLTQEMQGTREFAPTDGSNELFTFPESGSNQRPKELSKREISPNTRPLRMSAFNVLSDTYRLLKNGFSRLLRS